MRTCGARYKQEIARRVKAVRERHGLPSGPVEYRPEADDDPLQLSLF